MYCCYCFVFLIVYLFVHVKDALVVPRHSNQSPMRLLFIVTIVAGAAVKAIVFQRKIEKTKHGEKRNKAQNLNA